MCELFEFADAASFLSRDHKIGNVELIVQSLASSKFIRKNLPKEQLESKKLLVEWSMGAQVTHDDLQLYLSDVTQCNSDIIEISYVPKPNTALVELPSEWGESIYINF